MRRVVNFLWTGNDSRLVIGATPHNRTALITRKLTICIVMITISPKNNSLIQVNRNASTLNISLIMQLHVTVDLLTMWILSQCRIFPTSSAKTRITSTFSVNSFTFIVGFSSELTCRQLQQLFTWWEYCVTFRESLTRKTKRVKKWLNIPQVDPVEQQPFALYCLTHFLPGFSSLWSLWLPKNSGQSMCAHLVF